jgi:phage virion morphogenesis protein
MSGITLRIDDHEVTDGIRSLLAKVDHREPLMRRIGMVLRESVRRNFRAGGRPVKWQPSKRAKGDAAYGAKSGQTLVDTKRLMNSIAFSASASSVRVGTNVVYGAAHHLGSSTSVTQNVRPHVRVIKQAFGRALKTPSRVNVKGHSRKANLKLPARPWLMVQAEDWRTIAGLVNDYLTR